MNQKMNISDVIVEKASLFKVLSEPNRLMLLDKIMDGMQCNCELGSALNLAPNLISHHLSVLREAGLIKAEHDAVDARWIYYSVDEKMIEQIVSFFNGFFNPQRIKPRLATCGPSFSNEHLMDRSSQKT